MKCPFIRLLNLQYHSPQVLSGQMDTGCIINAPPSHGALQFIKNTHTHTENSRGGGSMFILADEETGSKEVSNSAKIPQLRKSPVHQSKAFYQ